ncbi:MAG: glutamate synthase large subunit [Wenyingzhuangia sp.]|jgi:glutamate synthase (NADPH) large chain|uniref:glutamate synthase large subunit n=1 Tax=Wenyingzhuangia sp. TaxID=1964193 RepID=UPI00321BED12
MIQKQGLYLPEFEHENCGAGFICNLKGEKTNQIIHDALEILVKLEHRGGVSADGKTGDGAGLLIDIPHDYFKRVCEFEIPEQRKYAVGMTFLPKNWNQHRFCKETFEKEISNQGLTILGWREVPVDSSQLGEIALASEPNIEQVFIDQGEFEENIFKAKLYAARKIAEHTIRNSKMSESSYFYLPSLSNTTLIYKGIIMPEDIGPYYTDLQQPDLVTRLALVHQRFSTNTMPAWELAQPFRFLCQNGEINTLRGNVSRMRVREEIMKSEVFDAKTMESLFPIILPGKSDSASMDMSVELLTLTGRSLPEVMMMTIPEAWEKHATMSEDRKAFYEYNSCIMEPWDGPASVPFTDGDYVGALLDRNGLRPSRYTVTKSGKLIMSSEVGVVDIAPEDVASHGRLEPGKMFLVDMNEGRIIDDEEIKDKVVSERPYKEWLNQNSLKLKDVPDNKEVCPIETLDLKTRQRLYNYTIEDIQEVIVPMAQDGKETLGSMGIDTPVAVLSDKPQLIPNYFKQLFAQVTNPPLDGIREEVVTDISLALGNDKNIFDITADQCHKLRIQNPVVSNSDLEKLRNINMEGFKSETIPMLYTKVKGMNGLEDGLDDIITQITKAVDKGINIIILSDRGASKELAPIPALLACSYVHHQMNRLRKRSYFDIVIESAEPREPHHFATLFGYGASAINPYMVNEIISLQVTEGFLKIEKQTAIDNFNKAIGKGILKIMNKIGISTLHSYRGSQIFEIVGFNSEFVNKYFPYTASRIEGIGLYEIEKEINERYKYAYPDTYIDKRLGLNIGGDYRWRRNGERHIFNPTTVAKLQQAVRLNDQASYDVYKNAINEQSKGLLTIRGLFEFTNFDPIPVDEVEPWTEIVKRFKTGAMSYGSISREAHENLAIAMNRLGGKSNSGEGGEDRKRFQPDANGDNKNSAIKQVASGRFGVTSHYLSSAKEIQIKMAQGAKPGEGGQLPGTKVLPWIADARNSTPFVGLISPPPHHDIYSIEDLAQLIYDLKNANREARINVKLVSEVGVGTIAAGVAKAKADVVLISGYDGGTGASPLTSLKHAGLPWELGLAEAQQTLVLNNLRSRIVVECDGQLKTGRDVAVAALLGAEEFGFATAPLVASGCIMMRKCHLNTCPVGIATQDKELRKNFKGTPEHVINYFYYVANELREIMAQLGFRSLDEMVGQTQKINANNAIDHYKAKGLDLTAILHQPAGYSDLPVRNAEKQDHNLDNVIDFKILKDAHAAIFRKENTTLDYPIQNTDRSVGAIVSNEISKIYGHLGLPEDTLNLNFTGSAGQSLGVFGAHGITYTVEGNTNDYLGKGLSGGKIIVKKPVKADFVAEDNIIVGNVCLFGAVQGQAFINGIAGERFAVRNSGATAVVEGVGDHGCEYMTGGRIVVLGETGRNFAAGMSGGYAFILDEKGKFTNGLCNEETIDFDPITAEDAAELKGLIEKHVTYTDSNRGKEILADWDKSLAKFVKVMPKEYKVALERIANEEPMFEELTVS